MGTMAERSTLRNEILAMLKRRPMNLQELTYGENRNNSIVESTMADLEREGVVKKTDSGNEWKIINDQVN